jgi:predicted N-acetyltransferase YhbS
MRSPATILPMTEADIDPATELLRQGNWGTREEFFRYAVTQTFVRPLVAVRDGQILGTGVASAHGRIGWVGTIFVGEAERGHGLGRALTEATIGELRAMSCETLVLVATDAGRPLYERLGFETRSFYQTFEIEGLPPSRAAGDARGSVILRRLGPSDLDDAATIDGVATGEDRRRVLAAMLDVEGGIALRDTDGALQGFVARAAWGGGATVATSLDAAARLLEARRLRAGPDQTVRAGTPIENEAGIAALEAAGWRPTYRARRMELGPRPEWRPDWLWGQFNMAIG